MASKNDETTSTSCDQGTVKARFETLDVNIILFSAACAIWLGGVSDKIFPSMPAVNWWWVRAEASLGGLPAASDKHWCGHRSSRITPRVPEEYLPEVSLRFNLLWSITEKSPSRIWIGARFRPSLIALAVLGIGWSRALPVG